MKKICRTLLASVLAAVCAGSTGVWAETSVYNYDDGTSASQSSDTGTGTSYELPASNLTQGGVTLDGTSMYNGHIRLFVSKKGRFSLMTTDGDPSLTTDDKKQLLNGIGSASNTSFSTIAVDKDRYIYGENGFSQEPEYSLTDRANLSAVDYGDIHVEQVLAFSNNIATGREDVLAIQYIVTNNGKRSRQVGVRIMLDTMLGSNDKAPFRVAGVGDVTTETEFSGSNIPEYWQAFDSVANPGIISHGAFYRQGDTNPPDLVQLTNWRNVYYNPWTYYASEGTPNNDSAVTVKWEQKTLKPKETRIYTTYYGMSELTQVTAVPLSAGIYSDSAVIYTSVDSQTSLPQYHDLTVTGFIENTGKQVQTNAYLKLELPDNIRLVSGSTAEHTFDRLQPGEIKQVTWVISVKGSSKTGKYPLRLKFGSDSEPEKIIKRYVKVNPKLNNKSSLDETIVQTGDTVTVATTATGGAAPYRYSVSYKCLSQNKWYKVQDFRSTDTVEIVPDEISKYAVLVTVKDANGSTSAKVLSFTANGPLKNLSTIDKTKIHTGAGNTAKITLTAADGRGGYQYSVLYKKSTDAKWTTLQSYSDNQTVTFKPTSVGKYYLNAYVKDRSGNKVVKTFTLTVTSTLTNTSTLSASSIHIGSSATIKASCSGGQIPYQYRISYKKSTSDSWITLQSYSENTSVTLTPKTVGDYDIRVEVKDRYDTVVVKNLTLKVNTTLQNTAKISSTSIRVGSTVTVTCNASGGKGTYLYSVRYRLKDSTDWKILQNLSTKPTTVIKPPKAGNYEVRVDVKDDTGVIKEKFFSLTVKK